jgi:hypothetical protein
VKHKIDVVAVVFLLIALASFVAAAKGLGHLGNGHSPARGFFSGG